MGPRSKRKPFVRLLGSPVAGVVLAAVLCLSALVTGIVWRSQPGYGKPVGYGWWHTAGTSIVDQYDRRVRIAAVTWFGMDTTNWVPAGLDYQPYKKIMNLTKSLGYNTIRLPFSNQLVEENPIVTGHVTRNPSFQGQRALRVLDAICAYAKQIGLKIILDDHRSAAAPANQSKLAEPLWYTPRYPEQVWIDDWQSLARRYRHNSAVIGFDLRNEPHTGPPGPWSLSAYLNQGATWGPYDGVDDGASDWRRAAEKAGNASLAINPHLLMFVEGLQLFPDASRAIGVDKYWWGGILKGVRSYPVVFDVPHQLVYSPHEYGPLKVHFWWFKNMTYDSLSAVWHNMWGYILDDARARYAAPIWIGEMGTCTDETWCVNQQEPDNEATWLHFLVEYLHNHPQVGWCVWALNGTNSAGQVANNGILNGKWSGVANQDLQNLLSSIEH